MRENPDRSFTPSSSELSLFFNNSIFGAFFMMLDEPIAWRSDGERSSSFGMIRLRSGCC